MQLMKQPAKTLAGILADSSEEISAELPGFYRENVSLTAVYTASSKAVKELLPHPDMIPVDLVPSRYMVARLVGIAIIAALVIDAISDPIVGYWSDNLRSRWGRRHPFMLAAALPVALSYFLLWNPPAGWSQTGIFWYLLLLAVISRYQLSRTDHEDNLRKLAISRVSD